MRYCEHDLVQDHEAMQRCSPVELPEARVFFCAKILERLAATYIDLLGLETATLYSNLRQIELLGIASRAVIYSGDVLRRVGNANRHGTRPITTTDAYQSEFHLRVFLEWVFESERWCGKETAKKVRAGFHDLPGLDRHFLVLAELEATADPWAWVAQHQDTLLESPYLAANAIEHLNYSKDDDPPREYLDLAQAFCDRAREAHPGDPRLLQLTALKRRWANNVTGALEIVVSESWNLDDGEAYGIKAGICREHARRERQAGRITPAQKWLLDAQHLYLRGWKESHGSDAYLGINAAATLLEAGSRSDAVTTAEHVKEVLAQRRHYVARTGSSRQCNPKLSLWDELSCAQAHLIAGNLDQAQRLYQSALHSKDCAPIQRRRAMEELGHTLASLRLPLSADMFLRRLSPRPLDQPHYRVGVIGHRAWNTEGVEEKVRERLRILRQQNPDRPLAIVSSLAEGADRLVVNEARALDPETSLIAVLPMPAEEYAKDFQPSETTTAVGTPADTPSAAEFWELLCSASEIHLAGPTDDWSTDNGRNRAYRRAARALVDGCDFLIVVWDGKAARGEGGTGETVAYADQVKLPIDLISVTRDLPAPPPAIPPTGDRALNTHAASNPWWCVSADTDPPALERTSTSASQRIAELLWGWPGTSPPCYWSPEERLQRLLACVAGKAELSPGVTAWDQVTHPLAWQATGLALDLDGMPPIAGRESLRSELLWLDRAYRCGELAEHGLDAGMLIRILVAWLTTGELLAWRSSKRVGRQPGLLWRLLMTLYHPRAVDHERKLIGSACRAVERLASRLGGVTAIRPGAHIPIQDPSDFPRFAETGGTPPAFSDQDVLRALIHRLWWARSRVALRAKNALHTETAPTLACDRESRVVDVRFHGIQRWLRLSRERGGLSVTSKGHSEAKAPRMYARTGASAFLELVTSELRRMLVSTLGYGSTLIDGGGRLRFRLLSSMSKVNENATSIDIEARVYDTLERVFLLNPTLSRTLVHEWQEAGGPISRERPGTGADESQIPRSVAIDLARELLPPVSITVWDSSDPAARPLQVPVRWRHGDAPATPSSVVVSPAAVLVELGMTTPIHRALHVGGAQGHQALLPRAPVREAIEQYMVLDLNRVGELFTRDRGEISLSLEAAARRSFRFSAHWIRALHQAVYVQNDPQLEISIHGGDDIVVISRNPHSSLKDFAAELDAQLWRLNRELPPCDRVSFAAGLITKKEKPGKEEPLAFARAAGALEEFAKASSRCDHEDFRCALVDKYWNAQAKYQRIRLGDGTNRKSVLATAEWTNPYPNPPYPNPMHQASLHPDVAVTPIPCDKVDLASPWRPVETEWLLNFLDQLAVRRASGTGDGRNLSFEIELVAGKKHAELRLFEGRVKPPKSTCTRAGHRACAGCEKFLEAP